MRTAGAASAPLTSRLINSTRSRGVSAGAKSPNQVENAETGPGLRERGHGRQQRTALRPGARQDIELFREVRMRRADADQHAVHMAADQIAESGRSGLVRHVHQIEAGALLQHLHAQVHRRAVARRGVGEFVRPPARFGDQLVQRADPARPVDDQQQVDFRQRGDRADVGPRRGRLLHQRLDRQDPFVGDEKRVAVGLRFGHGIGADQAAGPRLVDGEDRLLPDRLELPADEPRARVHHRSRSRSDDHANRLQRERIGGRDPRPGERADACVEKAAAVHGFPGCEAIRRATSCSTTVPL